MKNRAYLALFTFFGLGTALCFAQNPPASDIIVVSSLGQAISAVLHFAGVSGPAVGYLALAGHFVAKYLVNYTFKDSTGKWVNVLSHYALEGGVDDPTKAAPAKCDPLTETTSQRLEVIEKQLSLLLFPTTSPTTPPVSSLGANGNQA